MLREQLHIVERRARGREAGRRFDKVRAGVGDNFTHLDLLLVRKKACFNDDLQELSAASHLYGLDFFQQRVPLLILDPAEVDDHVHLVRAVFDRVRRLKALGLCCIIPIREADDRADGKLVSHILLRLLHIRCRNADACRMVLHTVVADCLDFRPRRRLA